MSYQLTRHPQPATRFNQSNQLNQFFVSPSRRFAVSPVQSRQRATRNPQHATAAPMKPVDDL
jgi:hypothetical protein